ncbi:hypothetical protein AQUCO_01800193v1 [Aquilegia coerulea]|uniref:Protein kinase domain-containing protein n=1 Tax=Aquilegia coerulea TaxID=218851 RepID=A0A2G5DKE2_AQUCA|nr:hypothetical protein AQUCO_01800193v1 [Aquilegia coerulea]
MVWFFLVLVGILVPAVHAKTEQGDVSALTVMYGSLNYPSQLTGWKKSGGDPCGDEWKGIKCSGSKVTEIKLSDLGLAGSMGYQLSSLTSVTYFDMSKNNLKGDIPYQLPPNAQYIDFSKNGMTGTVPYSISLMSDLKHLDLGHNLLKDQLSDMFGKMPKLNYMDLSDNDLSGNLPQSFGSLSSLKTLNLQNNKFSGPIDVLAKLPLESLNVQNNRFTGAVPQKLQGIATIQTGGNSFTSGGNLNRQDHKDVKDGKGMSGTTIAMIVIGVLVALVLLLALLSRKSSSSSSASHFLDEEKLSERRSFTPLVSRELEPPSNFKELKSLQSSASIRVKSLQISPSMGVKRPVSEKMSSLSDAEFANRLNVRRSTSIRAIPYTLTDLQAATGNFATGRLLGEGSIGRVYRAKYPDGKVVAVKKIDSSLFQNGDPEGFSEMVTSISKLHHQNIAELIGHCSEQGHNLLVYDYFRNGSLHDFLHLSDDYSKPLTWNTRIRIALGTARAVEYLHEVCSPSSVHKNIKSSNILLDVELNPHLSDCGLAIFHERTSQNLGVGYNAPECTKPSAYSLKSDVYSFGVVMLELLTGRKPFDGSKPKIEQSLVRWATPQLHDIDALAKMVDPSLRGLYPPKSLSRFADVIALCVQSEPEFRPPMSEVVQALVRLVQRSNMNMRDDLSTSRRTDDSDQSDYY